MRYLALLSLYLIFATYAYASSCEECHEKLPSDRSHRAHSNVSGMIPAYGDTGYTGIYAANASSYGFNCGNCHPVDNGKHKNGTVDVELTRIEGKGLRALNSAHAGYDDQRKRCLGVYCHSSGGEDGKWTYIKSPGWNREEKGNTCHECHDSPPVYKSSPQRPNGHFNAGRGSGHLLGIHWDSVKGHSKESFAYDTATQMGCSTCHYDTVRNDIDTAFVDTVTGLFTCVRCHELRDGEIFNYSLHVNGKVDIQFAPVTVRSKAQLMLPPRGWVRKGNKGNIMSYDEASTPLHDIEYSFKDKSCTNVACHLGAEKVLWHDEINCGDCHVDSMMKHK